VREYTPIELAGSVTKSRVYFRHARWKGEDVQDVDIAQKVLYSFHEMRIRVMFLLPTPLAYELKRYTAI
jgi:hypothetical protein